jgi:uncharacterized cofD-like protein
MNKKTVLTIIGGGHGLSNILQGLKKFNNLKIITAISDSGGSTGKIRNLFSCPAMGDIRLVLSTLGNVKIKELFECRIPKYKDCVGNLIIGSLSKLYSFDESIKIVHDLLGVPENHQVIPASLDNINLCGKYEDGLIVYKESDFTHTGKIKKIWLNPIPRANVKAINAIKESKFIIISPGSFFTSILANIIIKEIAVEINKKPVIYISNLLQQQGETIGFDLKEHFDWLTQYIKIDYFITNNKKPKEKIMAEKYESYLTPIVLSADFKKQLNDKKIICIEDDLINNNEKSTILHDYNKLYNILRKI